jgi:hypothetical protein
MTNHWAKRMEHGAKNKPVWVNPAKGVKIVNRKW